MFRRIAWLTLRERELRRNRNVRSIEWSCVNYGKGEKSKIEEKEENKRNKKKKKERRGRKKSIEINNNKKKIITATTTNLLENSPNKKCSK